jgi:RNA polymerase sigma-70 factor, ECF subfamily
LPVHRVDVERAPGATPKSFHDQFVELFGTHFRRIYRVLDRISGEPELAADLAQDAFVRLYRRGSLPEAPEAWLISVAMNLFRNVRTTRSRRRRLLTVARAEAAHADHAPSPDAAADAADVRRRVRAAIDRLPERERRLLMLRAEGYSYRDIAAGLGLHEGSVGTLLARAQRAFRERYERTSDAP